jgi:hypothetical protein
LTFGYEHARATRAAFEAYQQRIGVAWFFERSQIFWIRFFGQTNIESA